MIPMMENMVGEFARTMQSDRRMQAAKDARMAEAEHAHSPGALGSRICKRRAVIAKALITLATRIAPPMPQGAPRPGMMADLTN